MINVHMNVGINEKGDILVDDRSKEIWKISNKDGSDIEWLFTKF